MKRLCRDQPAFGCAARKSDPGKRPVWGSPRRFHKRKYPHPRLWSLPLVLNDHKYVPPRDHLFSDFQPSSSLQTTHSNTATMDPVPAPALFNLTGQNVLITGASRGIGAACAIALAEAGANICLVQRPASPTHSDTYNAIAALGRTVKVVECDLADLESVKLVFERALDAMGGEIHVLVNCAGIQRRSPAVQFTEGDWDDVRLCFLPGRWVRVFGPAVSLGSGWLSHILYKVLGCVTRGGFLLAAVIPLFSMSACPHPRRAAHILHHCGPDMSRSRPSPGARRQGPSCISSARVYCRKAIELNRANGVRRFPASSPSRDG
ncbi:hypothetical protein AcV7_002551 [Taiwanofungus camphoratus]|nr:hypothetical protein AcV7_002551 [Antrodia cinnamomea]